jgi:hypothetical protein
MKNLPVKNETSARSKAEAKALREIKLNVKRMLRDAIAGVDTAVEHCRACGIVEDHEKAIGAFVIPRDFLVAYCREITMKWGSSRNKERSDNYFRFI